VNCRCEPFDWDDLDTRAYALQGLTDAARPDPEVYYARAAELVARARVDRSYSVLELADRSADASVVYVSQLVPHLVAGVDSSVSLSWHELAEWLAMNDGWSYDEAHTYVARRVRRDRD
jgi:hypothetical protein